MKKDLREMLPYMDSDVTTFSDYSVISQNAAAVFCVCNVPVCFRDGFTQQLFWISCCMFCSVWFIHDLVSLTSWVCVLSMFSLPAPCLQICNSAGNVTICCLSVCPSVRPSGVTVMYCGHMSWAIPRKLFYE